MAFQSRSDENFYNPEPVLRQKWAENSLLNSMPVFQQGRVYFVDIYLWVSVTDRPLSDRPEILEIKVCYLSFLSVVVGA